MGGKLSVQVKDEPQRREQRISEKAPKSGRGMSSLKFWSTVERKYPNMKGTAKKLSWYLVYSFALVCISEMSTTSPALWALPG